MSSRIGQSLGVGDVIAPLKEGTADKSEVKRGPRKRKTVTNEPTHGTT